MSRTLCRLPRLLLAALFLVQAGASGSPSPEALSSVGFKYGEDTLYLTFVASKSGDVTVRYVPVSLVGRPEGRAKTRKFDVVPGDNQVALSPATESGHRVRLTFDGRTRELFANRGSWYVRPEGGGVEGRSAEVRLHRFYREGDLILSPAFAATARQEAAPRRITVGRSLGFDDAFGLVLDRRRRSLVLVAESSAGPVTVTLTERMRDDSLQYWDYPLVIGSELGRYEIPLDKFTPRRRSQPSLTAIHSVSLRTLRPMAPGSRLEVESLALSAGGPRIAGIRQDKKGGALVQVKGPHRETGTLYLRDTAGAVRPRSVDRATIPVPEGTEAVWLCFGRRGAGDREGGGPEDAERCDPADAPLTAYGVPTREGVPLVVDRFDTPAPVNAFRLPQVVFGASPEVERQTTVERLEETLRMTFYPDEIDEYAGYLSYLPEKIPRHYKTLSVTLRGSLTPDFILAGIKDDREREARIPFISYWPGDETAVNPLFDIRGMNDREVVDAEGFKTVRFPLDAFRAAFYNVFEGHAVLEDILGVSVTMTNGGPGLFHEVELKQVAFTDDIVPIVITAFDGDQYGINALGGVNFSESRNGGQIDVRLNADGYYGKGLRVEVTLEGPASYALVALGFGKLDVSDYTHVSFVVRGAHGDEDALVYLNDGKRRAALPLGRYIGVTKMWRKVRIPLRDFEEKGVDLSHLSQLVLAWESAPVRGRVLYFDDFAFE